MHHVSGVLHGVGRLVELSYNGVKHRTPGYMRFASATPFSCIQFKNEDCAFPSTEFSIFSRRL